VLLFYDNLEQSGGTNSLNPHLMPLVYRFAANAVHYTSEANPEKWLV